MRGPVILAVLTVAACATTVEPPAEYLLRLPSAATATSSDGPPSAALGRVEVAPYLDRSAIVIETGGRRLVPARDHRWAEPLPYALRRMLTVTIAGSASRSVADTVDGGASTGTVIDVFVHRLHGNLDGEVVLSASWILRDAGNGRILGRHELTRTTRTRAAGYDALVDAHAELVEALGAAIADTLPRSDAR